MAAALEGLVDVGVEGLAFSVRRWAALSGRQLKLGEAPLLSLLCWHSSVSTRSG